MPQLIMFHRITRATLVASLLTMSSIAVAQAPADDKSGRFAMAPIEGGVLRLDTMTGAVSTCTRSGTAWACKAAEDDMKALNGEIERLLAENRELKRQVEAGPTAGGLAPAPRSGLGLQLPSEQDVDKAFEQLERLMKRFQDRLKGLDGPRGRPL